MADETQERDSLVLPTIDGDTGADVLSEEFKSRRLAQRIGIEYVDLANFEIDAELFRSIPVDLMFRYNFVPRNRTATGLQIVVADPTDVLMIDELELLLGTSIEVVVGTPGAIQEILKKSESSQRVLEEATEEFRIQIVLEDDETGEETLTIDRLTSDQSPIIKLVDSTVFNALQRRASDIHIETRDREVVIKYRIDGVLYQAMEPIDKKFHQTIISRIKVMSELDISEKRVPQDGRFKLRIKGRTVDFRVSIMPSVHGEDCVIRILDKESTNREFASLSLDVCGFEDRDMQRMRRFIREPYGMVLVTGPTGSGKTTTLYAAISEIKNDEDKIITIEDPVEYQLPGITQIPVNEKKGLTFARGLRSILRHDPDKIMVGEIRDAETAQIAIQSALTGHLVFTTVHANNVVDVLGRFLNMGVEAYQFVSALNCVLAQRLARRLCSKCKEEYIPTAETLTAARFPWNPEEPIPTLYQAVGCSSCAKTGYKGRVALHEVMSVTDAVEQLAVERASSATIEAMAHSEGMVSLRLDGMHKVREGMTSLDEILRVVV